MRPAEAIALVNERTALAVHAIEVRKQRILELRDIRGTRSLTAEEADEAIRIMKAPIAWHVPLGVLMPE